MDAPTACGAPTAGVHTQRDDLEAVDVDEAPVGELQRRDHGERHERERQERRRARSSRAPVAASLHARLCATTTSSGWSESRPATGSGHSATTRPSSTTTMPPPTSASRCDGERHVLVARADDDEVVRVVRDGRGERAALAAPSPRGSARPMRPVARCRSSDRDLDEVALGVGDGMAVDDERLARQRLRDDLVGDEADRARRAAAPTGSRSRRRADRPDPHGLAHPLGHVGPRGTSSIGRPRFSTSVRHESSRDREAAGGRRRIRARPPRGGASRCHCAGWNDAIRIASAGSIPAATASRTMPLTWPLSTMSSGSRSSVQNAIRPGPYSATSGRSAVRLRAIDASRIRSHMPARSRSRPSSTVSISWSERIPAADIRLQLLAEDAGRVTVDVLRAVERELVELGRVARDHAREVHHLGEPEHPLPAHQRLEVAGPSGRRGDSKARGGDARRGHEEDLELEAGRGVEQPVDAVGAEHVRDLVRVGDDRGRAEREHETRELVDEELHGLEVHVRVDEARDDVPAVRVDRLPPSYGPTPAITPSTTATSASSHSRVKTESTRPPRTTRSAGSSPRATARRRESPGIR